MVEIEQLEPFDPVGRHKTEQNRTVGTEQLELLGLGISKPNRVRAEHFVTWSGWYLKTYCYPANSMLFLFCFEYLLIGLVLHFTNDEIFCWRCVTVLN